MGDEAAQQPTQKHWFPPLCVLSNCWCLRLQTGVVVVGVITALIGGIAFAYHITNFILAPALGEQGTCNVIHRNYNISMFKMYSMFSNSCKQLCAKRDMAVKKNRRTHRLMRIFLSQFPIDIDKYHFSLQTLRGNPESRKRPHKPLMSVQDAEHLVVPYGHLSQYGENGVERFMLDNINFEDPMSVAAGRAFWKAWKKVKAAMALDQRENMGSKNNMQDDARSQKIPLRVIHNRKEGPSRYYSGQRSKGKREIPPTRISVDLRRKDKVVAQFPFDITNETKQRNFSIDPCWQNCRWPRVIVDNNMNNVRLLYLSTVFDYIRSVSNKIETIGLLFAIVAMIIGPILVCGAVHNNPWKFIPWLVYGGFYALWCCFYVDAKTGMIFWEKGYWNKYSAQTLIVVTTFVIILAIFAIFVVMSYFYLIFTAGHYLHHFPRHAQLVVSGGVDE